MKRVLVLFIPLLLLAVFSGCFSGDRRSILRIDVSHTGRGLVPREYSLRVDELKLCILFNEDLTGEPSHTGEDGRVYSIDLDEKNMAAFLKACKKNRIAGWAGPYGGAEAKSEQIWHITIVFDDLSTAEITGRGGYPEGWDNMFDAFEALTGQKVLLRRGG